MALIVEDGSIVAGAESYCSVAAADDYHSKRGNAAWAALDDTTEKEPALRKATDYMVQEYRQRWKGYRKSATQALDWPRSAVYLEPVQYGGGVEPNPLLVSDTIVPDEVVKACAELAIRASTTVLSADLEQAVRSETVGPISTTYDDNSSQSTRYKAVVSMLSIYFTGTAFNMQLVR